MQLMFHKHIVSIKGMDMDDIKELADFKKGLVEKSRGRIRTLPEGLMYFYSLNQVSI